MAVPTRIVSEVVKRINQAANVNGGGTNYIVQTPGNIHYSFYIDNSTFDCYFSKSLNGGMSWETPVLVKAFTGTQIAVWYDRWSGINGDLIHIAYTDGSSDDVLYININTASSDTPSTEYTVFAGASTTTGGAISIARMRGGNLVVVGCIDAGTEVFSRKSTDVGVNWSDIAAGYEAEAADQCIVMPGWGADTQDAMMFYYDRSATEISVKYYDDSANTWSETSIATTISLPDHTTTSLGHIAASVDLTNSRNLLVFWTAVDTANADLRCFKVTQSAQTETTTNVILNSPSDQGFCGISISDSLWYVFYMGVSGGTEVYATSLSPYYKISADGGATWGSEIRLEQINGTITMIFTKPISYNSFGVAVVSTSSAFLRYNAPLGISLVTLNGYLLKIKE